MDGTVPESLLRDELWICGDALEDFSNVGAHYARAIYRSNSRKPEEPPHNERVREGEGHGGSQGDSFCRDDLFPGVRQLLFRT